MKSVIVNAFGRSNRGDAVLLDECISEIMSSFPAGVITAVVFEGIENAQIAHPNVTWTERLGNANGGLRRVKSVLYLAASFLWVKTGMGVFLSMLPAAQRATLRSMKDADIIVSAPGGYIHDTNFAYLIALFHIHIGRLLGKQVVLAPQSIGPVRGKLARRLVKSVLDKAALVCARESYTYNFLLEDLVLPAAKVTRAGDSAFWNSDIELDSALVDAEFRDIGIEESGKIFGITVVNWSFPASKSPEKHYSAYIAAMASMIDEVVDRFGLVPVIFNQVSEDIKTAREVNELARNKVFVDTRERSPALLRAMIRRSKVFVGTRFHSCIFAMMAGRPVTAISYLPKTEFIMQDLQLGTRFHDIGDVNMAQLVKSVERDYKDLGKAEAEISAAVINYRKNYSRFSSILSERYKAV